MTAPEKWDLEVDLVIAGSSEGGLETGIGFPIGAGMGPSITGELFDT